MGNSNDEFNNDKKPVDKRKMAKVLSSITFLALLFCGTYFITDYLNNLSKINDENGGEQIVVNQNIQVIKDDTIIMLKTKENIDSEKKMSELKIELGLTGDVTKDSLENALKSKGYSLGEIKDNSLVFNRQSEYVLVGNKFYLGEKEGKLAIYKANDSGEPTEISVHKTPINILPEENQEALKNFEKYYDTEEEAHMRLTAYTS